MNKITLKLTAAALSVAAITGVGSFSAFDTGSALFPSAVITAEAASQKYEITNGTILSSASQLKKDHFYVSKGKKFALILQNDGNLVLYKVKSISSTTVTPGECVWASGTSNSALNGSAYAKLQADGNFVIYRNSSTALWHTHTNRSGGGKKLMLSDDGILSVISSTGGELWASRQYLYGRADASKGQCNRLYVGQAIYSPNTNCRAILQADGNFVVYQGSGTVKWASGKTGYAGIPTFLNMQDDGNLVQYKQSNLSAVWSTGSADSKNRGNYRVELTNEGVLNLIDLQGKVKWSSAQVVSNGKFTWPVPASKNISSTFGMRNNKMHNGIDIAAPKGTNVYCADGGEVIKVYSTCKHDTNGSQSCNCNGGYGNYVVIRHPDGKETTYAHLNDVCVTGNSKIAPNTLIGHVGRTGNTYGNTGYHLHFGVKDAKGNWVNPSNYVK